MHPTLLSPSLLQLLLSTLRCLWRQDVPWIFVTSSLGKAPQIYGELSSFSTQHAQRCVPARNVVTQWNCYPENHVNAFFWIKETHWRRWGLPGSQNRTAAANAFFPVHKSPSATSASEQLLELLLLQELSEAGAFSAPVKPRFWARGNPALYRGPRTLPPCQRQRRTPRRGELVKQQQPH